jgi:hypothetical protein
VQDLLESGGLTRLSVAVAWPAAPSGRSALWHCRSALWHLGLLRVGRGEEAHVPEDSDRHARCPRGVWLSSAPLETYLGLPTEPLSTRGTRNVWIP